MKNDNKDKEIRIMKAVAYVRVSSERQESEGFSIPAQKKLVQDYAKKKDFQIIKIFEESQSAKRSGRSEFEKMIVFMKKNKISILLAEKTDRLYRNIKDYTKLDFDESGIEIHLVKENEVLSSKSRSQQKFIHRIKVIMAQNYSDNLSEEVKKGTREKASQGWYPSVAPIGYINKDKIIAIDPEKYHLIARAFELAATGEYSIARLSKKLFILGLKSNRSKKRLSKSRMSDLLKNPFYYGDFTYAGVKYPGKHKPIISFELYQKANEAMGFANKPKNKNLFFAFGNLMTCYYCGCAITAERKVKKSGKIYIYYHCTKGKSNCSNPFYLNEEKVEQIMAAALDQIKLSIEIIEWTRSALKKAHDEEREFRSKEISTLQNRYKQIESYQDKMYEDKLESLISEDLWKEKHNRYHTEKAEISSRLNQLENAANDFKESGIKLLELANNASKLFKLGSAEEKHRIAKLVLSNPVFKSGSIEYDYQKPFNQFVNISNLSEWRVGISPLRQTS